MKSYRVREGFTYHLADGAVVEPGEVVQLDDDVIPGHMLEEASGAPAQSHVEEHPAP